MRLSWGSPPHLQARLPREKNRRLQHSQVTIETISIFIFVIYLFIDFVILGWLFSLRLFMWLL